MGHRFGIAASGESLAGKHAAYRRGWRALWLAALLLVPGRALAVDQHDPAGGSAPKGLDCRSAAWRAILAESYGGNNHSEQAVAAALNWLVAHQMADGSWDFDFNRAPKCKGACGDVGQFAGANIAATGMALLPLLGAGHTHKQGDYKQAIDGGLQFLIGRIKASEHGGSLCEPKGNMYAHGIATIAVCEAYALTHDPQLEKAAKQLVAFIVYAQDPVGGGWRYMPRQPGDTSVLGWQLAALRAGQAGQIKIEPAVFKKAGEFLDGVQNGQGGTFGYTTPGTGPGTTAIGLLGRLELGGKPDAKTLDRGLQWLSETGPSADNFYYNLYATQVMFQAGGPRWQKWNAALREQIVKSQATAGHEKGSWFKTGSFNGNGGRLYCTALAALTLEVYYRYPRGRALDRAQRGD